jgi:hypothetical protein
MTMRDRATEGKYAVTSEVQSNHKSVSGEILVPLIPQAFTLNVAGAAIADLHSRLSRTRWPDQAPDPA